MTGTAPPYRVTWRYPKGRRYRDHSRTLARAVRIRDELKGRGATAQVQVLDEGGYRDMTDGEIKLALMPG